MKKIELIRFIKTSKQNTRSIGVLYRLRNDHLIVILRDIVKNIVRESEIIAKEYLDAMPKR